MLQQNIQSVTEDTKHTDHTVNQLVSKSLNKWVTLCVTVTG